MPITIIAIGKKHDSYINDGLVEFGKRLRKPFEVEWQLLPHNPVMERAVEEESERLLAHCKPDDFVILLDERGKGMTSPQFSYQLQSVLDRSQRIAIVIGGAYGVSQPVFDRANLILSLSPMVFPHQLVRLLLIEQIYRAQSIAFGESYHHE
jgi:23S rRNA (pseudouridine1915-N3)-methyltransferase